jgi:hypothetical protein
MISKQDRISKEYIEINRSKIIYKKNDLIIPNVNNYI